MFGNFFDTSGDTRKAANANLDKALGMFSADSMQKDMDFYRSKIEPLLGMVLQQQQLAGTMGARSAQTQVRRMLGPGSGVGEVGIGFELGSGFGAYSSLAYQAIADAMAFAERNAGAKSGVWIQKALAVLQTPKKSGWDTFREIGNFAGDMMAAFSGNPFSQTPSPAPGAGGVPLNPTYVDYMNAKANAGPGTYGPGYGPGR